MSDKWDDVKYDTGWPGTEEPPAVRTTTPEATCKSCHTDKHSDTFEYRAYMRDILGPGHGGQARKDLGEGSTGQQLRKAAMARARAEGAAALSRDK